MTTTEFHENRLSVDPIVIDIDAAAIDKSLPVRSLLPCQSCGPSSMPAYALFGKRELDILVWEDCANFDVFSEHTDVIQRRPRFDFGAFSKRETSLCAIFMA